MSQNISLLQSAYRFANKLFAIFSLDSNGNPNGFVGLTTLNANVIPRTNTLAQLELLVSTDNEIAVATDNAVLAVYRTGTSTPDLYYAKTAWAQEGLSQPIAGSQGSINLSAGTAKTTLGSSNQVYIQGNYSPSQNLTLTPGFVGLSNASIFYSTYASGNGTLLIQANAGAVLQSTVNTFYGTVIGGGNPLGEIFQGDFVYGTDNYAGAGTASAYRIKNRNTLQKTTSAGTAQALTFDGSAAFTSVTNPVSAPTAAAIAGGTIPAGAHTVSFSWINAYGETLPSPTSSVTTTVANATIQVTVPTLATNATLANIYIDGTLQEINVAAGGSPHVSSLLAATPATASLNTTSNQLSFAPFLLNSVFGIYTAQVDIFARQTSGTGTGNWARATRQIDINITSAGVLSIASATGNTIGAAAGNLVGLTTDTLWNAIIAFSVSGNLLVLTVTPGATIGTNGVSWSATFNGELTSM